jgi:Ni,Fe-hydrogenase III large subunit/Ni,Fe-hydrogenase III component G
MRIADHDWPFNPQGEDAFIHRGEIAAAELPALAADIKDSHGQLLALWGSDDRHLGGGFTLHAAFLTPAGLLWISAALPAEAPAYPDLARIFPQAGRMQRAIHDLLGMRAEGAKDQRKWLRHGAWAEGSFPLRRDFDPVSQAADEIDGYPFVRVEGEGVHEIPVGPIHAGVIEPGHFRFSIIGDRVLKLEERLGYTHKGTEKRFEGLDLATGARLAGRVSGDSHSAFAWAYCMAAEAALGVRIPEPAAWLRALFLEMERVSNHLGDLGYLGNDAGFGLGFVQFWRLKEEWLRRSARLFGHRYLFDLIYPGGVARGVDKAGAEPLRRQADELEVAARRLKAIYDEHAGVQDRFANTGIVPPKLAARLGLIGLAGRASGQGWDPRRQFPAFPYDRLDPAMVLEQGGDVLARVEVRFAELFDSLRMIRAILDALATLGDAPLAVELPSVSERREGIGWVEGWRGPVVVALAVGADGRIDRCHPHDPSWQNWPLLEVGILGNIVPDFPLINKSFNLSYSGQDL